MKSSINANKKICAGIFCTEKKTLHDHQDDVGHISKLK